jgi:transposase
VHSAFDTLGHPLALHVTPSNAQDRAQVGKLAEAVQQIAGDNVEPAYVDQGYTGENAAQAAARYGIQLEVVKYSEAKRGFVLLPRGWVVERSFAWPPASSAWPETTNDSARPLKAFTTSRSSCSQI